MTNQDSVTCMLTLSCFSQSGSPADSFGNIHKLIHDRKSIMDLYYSTRSKYPIHLKHD
jgi:hypothetical protein